MKKIYLFFFLSLSIVFQLSAQITNWITAITPQQNAIIEPDTQFDIEISEAINGDAVQEGDIVIYGTHSGFHDFNFDINGVNTHIFLDPDINFKVGETVFLTMTTNLENLNGDKMPVPMTAVFYVRPTSASGIFEVQPPVSTSNVPYSLTTADFDGDGSLDIATANRTANNVNILFNDGNGILSNVASVMVGLSPESIISGDWDADSDMDLAVTNSSNQTFTLLQNDGTGDFTSNGDVIVGTTPHGINMGDIDGDGDLDLVTSNFSAATLSIVENDGNGAFMETFTASVGSLPEFAIIRDFDNDGDLDLASPSFTNNSVFLLDNIGEGIFDNNGNISVGNNPHIPFSGDLDGDGFEDLLIPNASSNSIQILSNIEGNFSNEATIPQNGRPYSGITFDMDGDGDLDAAVPFYQGSNIRVYENDGAGNLTEMGVYGVGNQPHVIVSGDFNNDGAADLAVCNDASNSVQILLNEAVDTPTKEILETTLAHQVSPNPSDGNILLYYHLPQSTMIEITIYNQLGQHLVTPFKGKQAVGEQSLSLAMEQWKSGIYFYKIKGEQFEGVGRIILNRF